MQWVTDYSQPNIKCFTVFEQWQALQPALILTALFFLASAKSRTFSCVNMHCGRAIPSLTNF